MWKTKQKEDKKERKKEERHTMGWFLTSLLLEPTVKCSSHKYFNDRTKRMVLCTEMLYDNIQEACRRWHYMKHTIITNNTHAAILYPDIAQLLERIPSFWKNVSAIFNRSILHYNYVFRLPLFCQHFFTCRILMDCQDFSFWLISFNIDSLQNLFLYLLYFTLFAQLPGCRNSYTLRIKYRLKF